MINMGYSRSCNRDEPLFSTFAFYFDKGIIHIGNIQSTKLRDP